MKAFDAVRGQRADLEQTELASEPASEGELQSVVRIESRKVTVPVDVEPGSVEVALPVRCARIPFERWRSIEPGELVGVEAIVESSLIAGPLP